MTWRIAKNIRWKCSCRFCRARSGIFVCSRSRWGRGNFEILVSVGEAIGQVLAAEEQDVLLLTTSDLNHYEDDVTTRVKDG